MIRIDTGTSAGLSEVLVCDPPRFLAAGSSQVQRRVPIFLAQKQSGEALARQEVQEECSSAQAAHCLRNAAL